MTIVECERHRQNDLPTTPGIDLEALEADVQQMRLVTTYNQDGTSESTFMMGQMDIGDMEISPRAEEPSVIRVEIEMEEAYFLHSGLKLALCRARAAHPEFTAIEIAAERKRSDPSGMRLAGVAKDLVDLNVIRFLEFTKIVLPDKIDVSYRLERQREETKEEIEHMATRADIEYVSVEEQIPVLAAA